MENPLKDKGAHKLNEQQKLLLKYMLGEAKGDPALAAHLAGYAPSYVHEAVKKIKDELIDAAKGVLALYSVKAAYALADGLDDDSITPNVKTKMRAAEQILDRLGVHKNEQGGVNLEESGAILLFPAKIPQKEMVHEKD